MRFFALLLVLFTVSTSVVSQQSGTGTVAQKDGVQKADVKKDSDTEAYEKAIASEDPFARIEALKAFILEFGTSSLRTKALESLVSARAAAADTKLRSKDPVAGVNLFKLAVAEAPNPTSDDLFSKILVNIPINLFLLEQRDAAFEIANMLEARSSGSSKRLIRLATFYFAIKYATGARRLAEKARDNSPEDPLVYQSLGAAHRLGYDLNSALEAYAKALSLDPDSVSIKQNLADMKRATGDTVVAEALYKEILENQPDDIEANTGLVLNMFDQGRRGEAEKLLAAELARHPSNAFLLTGAANWYAANGEPDLAIANAQEALSLDQSSIWAYIVIGRAFMKKGDPVSAEKSFLSAAGLAPTPTVVYELALARMASGFYKDALDVLSKVFLFENGKLVTDLDGRIGVEADNFTDLISLERKSTLFTGVNGYEPAGDSELKALFNFDNVVKKENASAAELESSSNAFIGADDAMRTHRQLFVAEKLLDAGKSPDKAGQIAQDAIGGVEKSVEIAIPSAAVMADQLFEGRRAAAAAGRLLVIPEIEKSTLLRIMRGRIEEIAARSALASGDVATAQIRLKRAVTVLPADSAWWRSSMWRLGKVYEQVGDDRKALESYASSYRSGDPTAEKKKLIDAVYQRVNGSLDGLDNLLAKKGGVSTDAASQFVKAGSDSGTQTGTDGIAGETDVPLEAAQLKTAVDETLPVGQNELSPAKTTNSPQTNSGPVAETRLPENVDLSLARVENESKPIFPETKNSGKPETVLTDKAADIEKPALENSDKDSAIVREVSSGENASANTIENGIKQLPVEATSLAETHLRSADASDPGLGEKRVAESADQEPGLTKNIALRAEPVTISGATVAISKEPVEEPAGLAPNAAVQETPKNDLPVQTLELGEKAVVKEAPNNDQLVQPPEFGENAGADKTSAQDQPIRQSDLTENPVTEAAQIKSDVEVMPVLPKIEDVSDSALNAKSDVDETKAVEAGESPVGEPEDPIVEPETDTTKTETPVDNPSSVIKPEDEYSAADLIDMGATRPRFVAPDKVSPKPDACSVVLSQDTVSLIANGGGFGIVVGVINYDQPYVLRARTGSPENISIKYEPDIGSANGRAFFIVRSISNTTGVFNIFFETPCGNKTVRVEVY